MKTVLIALFLTIGIFEVSFTDAAYRDLVKIKRIQGTGLYTGVFYRISMKNHPKGWITWTEKETGDKDGNYVQIDLSEKNWPHYEPGEKWENATQWFFESSEAEGYYNLKNKGLANAILTTRTETFDSHTHNHLIVVTKPEAVCKHSALRGASRQETLIKPVKMEGGDRVYRLKFETRPEATVTWTEAKYRDRSHFIQLDDKEDRRPKYRKGGEWFEDTKFEFIPTADTLEIMKRVIAYPEVSSC